MAAHAPVLRDFLDRAQDLYLNPDSGLDESEHERFEKVFAWQKRMDLGRAHVEMDLDNLEDLFGLVDLQCRIGNDGAKEVRESLTYVIERTLRAFVNLDDENLRSEGYDQFAGLVCRRHRLRGAWVPDKARQGAQDAVITLNYDRVMETAMHLVDVEPDRVIVDCPSTLARLPILKLHGSIDWRICREPTCRAVFVDDDLISKKQCPQMPYHDTERFIVPPTWDKGSGNQAISKVWAAAHRHLVQAHRWIIIGYSAPPSDRFFQYLLGSAIAENKHLEVLAVFNYGKDKDEAAAIRTRYEKLFTSSFAARRLEFRLDKPFPLHALEDLWKVVASKR